MLKNLKKKIEQGVAQSKAAVSGLTGIRADDSIETTPSSEAFDQSLTKSVAGLDVDQPQSSSAGLTSTTATSSQSSPGGSKQTPLIISGSQVTSASSMLSDSTLTQDVVGRWSSFDQESAEPVIDPNTSTISLQSVSKEELYTFVKRFEQRAIKYKAKIMELTTAYREVAEDRDRIKTHLQKLTSGELETSTAASITSSSPGEDLDSLKARINRQDGLLQKCRDTITNYKEKVTALSQDNQELMEKLNAMSKAGGGEVSVASSDQVLRLQAQVLEAKKIIQHLESEREVAIAEVKHQIHEEMDKKDTELESIKAQYQKCLAENTSLKLSNESLTSDLDQLRQTNEEQLTKARTIIKRLKEDRRLAIEQAETRIKQAEQSMEEEKEKMLIDLKRGKAEAFSVMQLESEKNLAEKVEAAILERDRYWQHELKTQEETFNQMLKSKDRDKELAVSSMQEEVRQRLKEKEDEVLLALEERELQKMAAVSDMDEQKDQLLLQIEALSSARIDLENTFSKFQEDAETQMTELRDQITSLQVAHSRDIAELQQKFEEQLEKEKNELVRRHAEEMEIVNQRHTEEMQSLEDKREQDLQETSAEMESYCRSQFEQEQRKLENLLAVTQGQLEELKKSKSWNQSRIMETQQELLVNSSDNFETTHPDNKEVLMSPPDDWIQGSPNQAVQEVTPVDSFSSSRFSAELVALRQELTATQSQLSTLRNEKVCLEEKCLQLTQAEKARAITESHSQELLTKVTELTEENECLKKNIDNCKIQLLELEKRLEEADKEKTAAELNSKDLEVQVSQLKLVIRSLEAGQTTVEKDKTNLENKLSFLESILEELKFSKEELKENLHEKYETWKKQSSEDREQLELRISEMSSQLESLRSENNILSKSLLSKNDENIALRSVVDDNSSFVRSLESKIEMLTSELQEQKQANVQSEAALAKSLAKFEKLKNEANAKVKGLKEMKDSLTEQLNQKQKECEEMKASFSLQKQTQLQTSQDEQFRVLEQTLKEQFEQKRMKFKETVNRLKEIQANKLQEKDKQIEELFDQLEAQKALAMYNPGRRQSLTRIDNQNGNQEISNIQCHQETMEFQEKLRDDKLLLAELEESRRQLQDAQADLEATQKQLLQISEGHSTQIDSLSSVLAEKEAQLQQLRSNMESLQRQSSELLQFKDKCISLEQQLLDKDVKLEVMAGTISAEQEYLHKQLNRQTVLNLELEAQNTALLKQLKDAHKEKDVKLQQKEDQIASIKQSLTTLETDCNLLRSILKNDEDVADVSNGNGQKGLPDLLWDFRTNYEKSIHNLEQEVADRKSKISGLEKDLQNLNDHQEKILVQLSEQHNQNIDSLRQGYEAEVSSLTSLVSHLQAELQSQQTDSRSQFELYEFENSDSDRSFQQSTADEILQPDLIKHETEQKVREVKHKFTARLKEVQKQAKETIVELETLLQAEKAAKSKMYDELARANTRLLQLEKNSGQLTQDTMVDLERKVMEMTALLETKERELAELRSEMAKREKSMQKILKQTQTTCKEMSDKFLEAEAQISANEAYCHNLNALYQEKLALLEQNELLLNELEKQNYALKEKYAKDMEGQEFLLSEGSRKVNELEESLQKTQSLLDEANKKLTDINQKTQDTISELCLEQTLKQNLEKENLHLAVECETFRCKLQETEAQLASNIQNHSLIVEDLEKRQTEMESSKENVERDFDLKIKQIQNTYNNDREQILKTHSELLNQLNESHNKELNHIQQAHSEELNHIQQAHSEELNHIKKTHCEELVQMQTHHSNEIMQIQKTHFDELDQIKKSHTQELNSINQIHSEEISKITNELNEKLSQFSSSFDLENNMKMEILRKEMEQNLQELNNQLQTERNILNQVKEEKMSSLACIQEEVQKLKVSKEKLHIDVNKMFMDFKDRLKQAAHLQEQGVDYCHKQDQEFRLLESNLKFKIESVLSDRNSLLEEIAALQKFNEEIVSQLNVEQRKIAMETENFQKQIEAFESKNSETIKSAEVDLEPSQTPPEEFQSESTTFVFDMEAESKLDRSSLEREDSTSMTKPDVMEKEQRKIIDTLRQRLHDKENQLAGIQQESEARIQHLQAQYNWLEERLQSLQSNQGQGIDSIQTNSNQPQLKDSLGLAQIINSNGSSTEMLDDQATAFVWNTTDETLEPVAKMGTYDDDDPPLSLGDSFVNHEDTTMFREPTEFEYLKNILYEYMMGRETKTLTKVIATVVKFSDEQIKNVMEKANTTLAWKS